MMVHSSGQLCLNVFETLDVESHRFPEFLQRRIGVPEGAQWESVMDLSDPFVLIIRWRQEQRTLAPEPRLPRR
jgi:hypothetical protein